MSTIITHQHTVGDTLTPLGWKLRRRDPNGNWESPNLTGLEVKFRMVAEDGTVIVDDDDTGITVTNPTAGEGQYDFQPDDVIAAGIYYVWVRTYDPDSGERDTYPAGGRKFMIDLRDAE